MQFTSCRSISSWKPARSFAGNVSECFACVRRCCCRRAETQFGYGKPGDHRFRLPVRNRTPRDRRGTKTTTTTTTTTYIKRGTGDGDYMVREFPRPRSSRSCVYNIEWVYAVCALRQLYRIKCALYSCGVRSRGRPEPPCIRIYGVEPLWTRSGCWWCEGLRKRRYDVRIVFFRFYIIHCTLLDFSYNAKNTHCIYDRTHIILYTYIYFCDIHTCIYSYVLFLYMIAYIVSIFYSHFSLVPHRMPKAQLDRTRNV